MGLLDKLKKDKDKDKKDVGEKTAKVDNEKKESVKKIYEDKKNVEGKKDGKRKYDNAYKALIRPLVTEKASVMNSLNKYFFEVAKNANKIEVAKAIQEIYGVKPVSVNIIRMQGKKVGQGRTRGKRKDWKKAIITLKKGESIKVYEGV